MKQTYWEITDFTHGECDGGYIYADVCKIFAGVGAMFYQDGNLIQFIEAKIESVNLIDLGNDRYHYYLKTSNSSNSIYLKKCKEVTKEIEKGVHVILKDEDVAWKLTIACSEEEDIFERFYKEIEHDHMWTVLENIESRILHIEKNGIEKYVKCTDAMTVEEIQGHGKDFRLRKEKNDK